MNEGAVCQAEAERDAERRRGRSRAPELPAERWFDTDEPITLAGLRRKMVVIHASQMLCPARREVSRLPLRERSRRWIGDPHRVPI